MDRLEKIKELCEKNEDCNDCPMVISDVGISSCYIKLMLPCHWDIKEIDKRLNGDYKG